MTKTLAEPEYDALGIHTLVQLAEDTGVPVTSLRNWVYKGLLTTVRVQGIHRSTRIEVLRVAQQFEPARGGRPRGWDMRQAKKAAAEYEVAV